MEQTTCRGCGASGTGRYCAACGQPAPRPDDFSLRRLAADAWAEVSDTDSRLWLSLRGLAVPGRLTRAWLDHEWSRHLPPLRLYLIVSGVYFLLAWNVVFQISADLLRASPTAQGSSHLLALYNDPAAVERVSHLTALFKFLFVVPMGFWLALLLWRSRRPSGEHMVFSLHYTTVDFVLFSLLAGVIALTPDGLQVMVYGLSTLLGPLLMGSWAILAVRRVYGHSWFWSVPLGLAVLAMDVVLSLLATQLAPSIVLSTLEWPA